jgi:hypothetical protein
MSWEAKAAAKRSETLAKIPPEWRLSAADLDKAKQRRDLTGPGRPFIEDFLTPQETAVVEQNAHALLTQLRQGEYSAVQVTSAFCKAAAIAHQIVSGSVVVVVFVVSVIVALAPLHIITSYKSCFHNFYPLPLSPIYIGPA